MAGVSSEETPDGGEGAERGRASYSPATNPDLTVLRCPDGTQEAWRAAGAKELGMGAAEGFGGELGLQEVCYRGSLGKAKHCASAISLNLSVNS